MIDSDIRYNDGAFRPTHTRQCRTKEAGAYYVWELFENDGAETEPVFDRVRLIGVSDLFFGCDIYLAVPDPPACPEEA